MPTDPIKTLQTAPLAWQDVAAGAVVLTTPVDVSDIWAVAFNIQIGRRSGTAFSANSPNLIIEASLQPSGGDFAPIFAVNPPVGASIANTTLSAGITAGATSFGVASVTNIALGAVPELLFLSDSSAANYEIVQVQSVSGTTITPVGTVINNHANGALVTDQAVRVITQAIDIKAYQRLRVFLDNVGSARDIAAQVQMLFVTW